MVRKRLAKIADVIREHTRRYRSRRVLAIWAVLTGLVAGYVYGVVGHGLPFGHLRFGFLHLTPFVYGVVAVSLGGLILAVWARHPLYALCGVLSVGIAALSVSLGCPAVGCTGVEQFHVFFEWTLLGPTISASNDAGRCAYICPHTVELVPLTIGYLLIGESLTKT